VTSDITWWMVGISIVGAVLLMYHLGKRADRIQLRHMRSDGLTEEDIKDIVGIKGYSKLIAAQGGRPYVRSSK
jgi:hypothetical protein